MKKIKTVWAVLTAIHGLDLGWDDISKAIELAREAIRRVKEERASDDNTPGKLTPAEICEIIAELFSSAVDDELVPAKYKEVVEAVVAVLLILEEIFGGDEDK